MKDKRTKVISALIALLASILLWFYVVTVISPERTDTIYDIPVVFSGEETLRAQNLVITAGTKATVDLTITGKRSDLVNLNRDNITVIVDVSKIREAAEFSRSYTISYPSTVQGTSLTVETMAPAEISFTVEQLVTKEIPIELDYSGCTFAEGYKLDSCKSVIESLSVTGTEKEVDKISTALVTVTEEEISEGFTKNFGYTLLNETGSEVSTDTITVDFDKVGVKLSLLAVKEIPLWVTVEPSVGAGDSNVDIEIFPQSITISGNEAQVSIMNKIVLDTVYMADILEDTEFTRAIILPDGVTNESGEIIAEVRLTLVGLEQKSIRATKIDFRNQPSGYVILPSTESVSVLLRGSASALASVSPSDIRLVVDLSSFGRESGHFSSDAVTVILENGAACDFIGNCKVEFTMMTNEEYIRLLEQEAENGPEETEEEIKKA